MEASSLVFLLLIIPISGHLNDAHYNTTQFKYNALKDIMYTQLARGPYFRYFVSTFYANSLDAKSNCESINGRIVKLVDRSQLNDLVTELEKGHNYEGQTFHIGGVRQQGRWTFVGRGDQDLHTHWHRPGAGARIVPSHLTTGLPKISYGGVCHSASDCPFDHSVCVSGACKCDMEHKYDPSNDICVNNCAQYGDDFTIYETAAVRGQNHETFQVSGGFAECAALCLAESFTTLSIDFKETQGTCKCSATAPGMEGVQIGRFQAWVLAVRQCAGVAGPSAVPRHYEVCVHEGKTYTDGETLDSDPCCYCLGGHVACAAGCSGTLPPVYACEAWEFTCQNGECMAQEVLCDGHADCYDAEDELGCPAPYDGNCHDASDCSFDHSVCVSGVCKCDMEHKYDPSNGPSNGICVNTCAQYGDDFTIYETVAVQSRNDRTFQVSGGFSECAALCIAESFTTLSIDFKETQGTCKCSASAPGMKGVKIGTFPAYVLAVRQCAVPRREQRLQHCAALIYRRGQFKMDSLSCGEHRHRYICQRHTRDDGPSFTSD